MPPTEKPSAIYLDTELSWLSPEDAYNTPDDVADNGLGGMLDRLAKVVRCPSAAVLLGGNLPALIGLPGTEPPAKPGPAKASAQAHGWQLILDRETGRERPWLTALKTETLDDGEKIDREIHVGILPWFDNETAFYLRHINPSHMLWRMERWYSLTGVPFYGNGGGVAGINIIRDSVTPKTRKDNRPFWTPPGWNLCPPARSGATERPDKWRTGRPHPHRWEHQYDVTRQHLTAMQSVTLAPGQLHRDTAPPPAELRNAAGYYLITVPRLWDLNGQIPHPAGSAKRPDEQTWVTHATLNLLFECAEHHHLCDYPEIHERWVSHREDGTVHYGTKCLGRYAERMADALQFAHTLKQVRPEELVLFTAVKQNYKRVRGLLHVGGRIHRPDWAVSVIAHARTVLWRKVYCEGMRSGRWPVEIDADAVWYSSDNPDPREAAPATFELGDGSPIAGTFTIKGTREAVHA